MTAKIIQFNKSTQRKVKPYHRPKNFTRAEHVLDELRANIFKDGRPFKIIGGLANVAPSTIHNIASGKTRWPRHTTLFPLIAALGLVFDIHPKVKK